MYGLASSGCTEPALAAIVGDDLHVDLLQHRRHRALAVPRASPARDCGHFASQLGGRRRQADGYDVLLVDHVAVQSYERHIVLEIGGIVVWMHLLALDAVLLVIEPLLLATHVPLAQADLHVGVGGAASGKRLETAREIDRGSTLT